MAAQPTILSFAMLSPCLDLKAEQKLPMALSFVDPIRPLPFLVRSFPTLPSFFAAPLVYSIRGTHVWIQIPSCLYGLRP